MPRVQKALRQHSFICTPPLTWESTSLSGDAVSESFHSQHLPKESGGNNVRIILEGASGCVGVKAFEREGSSD